MESYEEERCLESLDILLKVNCILEGLKLGDIFGICFCLENRKNVSIVKGGHRRKMIILCKHVGESEFIEVRVHSTGVLKTIQEQNDLCECMRACVCGCEGAANVFPNVPRGQTKCW